MAYFPVSYTHLDVYKRQGMRYNKINAFTVQFHPEAHGGPQDTDYLFDEFIDMIKKEMH